MKRFDVDAYNDAAMTRVQTTPPPADQKFLPGARVRIADDLGPSMRHFPCGVDATVLYSYAHAYGGAGSEEHQYALDVDGRGHCAWFNESQLTLIDTHRPLTMTFDGPGARRAIARHLREMVEAIEKGAPVLSGGLRANGPLSLQGDISLGEPAPTAVQVTVRDGDWTGTVEEWRNRPQGLSAQVNARIATPQVSGGGEARLLLCDGKYEVVREVDGDLYATRYGEFWRDLTGDHLVAALMEAALSTPQARPDGCDACGDAGYTVRPSGPHTCWKCKPAPTADGECPKCGAPTDPDYGHVGDCKPAPTADGGALPNAEEGDFDCPKAAASRSCPCGFCNALRRGAPKADVARLVEQLAQIRDRETTNIPDGQALTRAIEVLAPFTAAQQEGSSHE